MDKNSSLLPSIKLSMGEIKKALENNSYLLEE
jgi:hypothetical protein